MAKELWMAGSDSASFLLSVGLSLLLRVLQEPEADVVKSEENDLDLDQPADEREQGEVVARQQDVENVSEEEKTSGDVDVFPMKNIGYVDDCLLSLNSKFLQIIYICMKATNENHKNKILVWVYNCLKNKPIIESASSVEFAKSKEL